MRTERRTARRYSIAVTIPLNGGGTATIANLSSGGIYFYADQPLISGQEISLVLPFRYMGPAETRVTCKAQVVRVDDLVDRYGVAATYEPVAFELDAG